ncbi:MAG: galactokinase, partial [Planctomycetota bacterium]
ALEVAVIGALYALAGHALPEPLQLAQQAQRAEQVHVGVNCGILDHLASAAAQPGHAIQLDCRALTTAPVPMPAGYRVVILDTGKRRGLVDSAYNERRGQCEAGAAALALTALRDADEAQIEAAQRSGVIDAITARRCAYVVAENERVEQAVACLEAGDVVGFGRLMVASHVGLRDHYNVSCPELDAMVAAARAGRGCVGARMTGAGFGGCAVALVAEDAVEAFVEETVAGYRAQFNLPAQAFVTAPAAGAVSFLHM